MQARDILVVDDDPGTLLAIEAALADLGEDLVLARSGTEALRFLLSRDFALVLLDVRLPDVDGIETARALRSRERGRAVPILFMSGYDQSDRRVREAYSLGAVDFLAKPVAPEVLRAKATILIELQRQAASLAENAQQIRHAKELDQRVAERDAAQAELRRINTKLERIDRRKDAFLAMLAHELRNALSPLGLALELLKRQPPTEQSKAYLEPMGRQLVHMQRLVEDLLDVSRIRTGALELRRAPIDLREVVPEAIELSKRLIDEKEHELAVSVGGDALIVDGDRVRLVQVLSNLVNNAARYTPRGGRIEVRASRDGARALVAVSDNGQGIAPDMMETIFDAYVQAEPGAGSGLGIGLHLVQHLVRLHEGTIDVHSEGLGLGSRFEVRLPLAQ